MSAAEKTEKPTPQRLRKEGRKGKSYSSRDLLAAAALWAGVPVLVATATLAPLAALYMDAAKGASLTPGGAVLAALKALALTLAPVLLACAAATTLVSLWMSRGVLASEAVRVDLARLNPVTGFKNLFSLKVLKDLLRALLYLGATVLFSAVAWRTWGAELLALVNAGDSALALQWPRIASGFVLGLLLAFAPVYLLSGWLDHVLFIREMKTAKHEARREQKENDIKPEVRNRRREIAEELSAQVQADTLGSSFVLANPTHVAIGIYIADQEVPLPFVAVREKNARARKVIALAEAHGVPVVRDVALARAIYARSRRYRFVEDANIDAVMAVVRWLRDVERASRPPEPPPDPAAPAVPPPPSPGDTP